MLKKRCIFMLITMLFLGAIGRQLAAQERTVKEILQHADRARGTSKDRLGHFRSRRTRTGRRRQGA